MDKLSKLVITIILIIAFALSVWVFTQYSSREISKPGGEAGQGNLGYIVINDALGRQVNITTPPQRVISLAPSITEMLASLGLLNSVVAVDSYSLESWYMNTSEVLKSRNVTSVGGYWWSSISVEKIIELSPDLVLADKGAHSPLLDTLEQHNVTVVFLNGGSATSISKVYEDIGLLGKIFNKENEAERLISNIESKLENAYSMIQKVNLTGTRVLIVVDFWQGIWVAGKNTYVSDILERLGLVNVAETEDWSAVNLEIISRWKPDVIIVACSYANETVIRESGIDTLGIRLVILEPRQVDIVSRPGPLLIYIDEALVSPIREALGK